LLGARSHIISELSCHPSDGRTHALVGLFYLALMLDGDVHLDLLLPQLDFGLSAPARQV